MIATDTPERLELINRSSKKLKVCPKEKVKKKLFVNEEEEESDLEENECDMELQKLSDEEDYPMTVTISTLRTWIGCKFPMNMCW